MKTYQFLPLFILLLVMLASTICNAQQEYSLEDMITIGATQNRTAQQIKMQQTIVQADQDVLDASQQWRLDATGQLPNYFKSSSSVVQPNGSLAFQNISQNTASAGVTLSKPLTQYNSNVFLKSNFLRFDDFANNFNLYNGSLLSAGISKSVNQFNNVVWQEKILKQQNKVLTKQLNAVTNRNAYEISQNYFALLRAQVNQQIASSNKASAHKVLEIAQLRHQLGKISKSDLLQIELTLKNSEQASISANRDVINKSYQLKQSANLFTVGQIVKVKEPVQLPQLKQSEAYILEKAWANNPNLEQYELTRLNAERDMNRIEKENGFRANIEASLGLVKSGEQLFDVFQSPKPEAMLNVSFSVPIFDGGFKEKSLARAKLTKAQTKLDTEIEEQQFKENLKQLIAQVNYLQQEVETSKQVFSIAKERYEIANKRFALGNINITDLNIAYAERDNAWRGYIFTLENYYTNYYFIQSLIQ